MPSELFDELSHLLKSEDAQELHRRETAKAAVVHSSHGEREEALRYEVLKIESYERMKKQKLQVIADVRSQNSEAVRRIGGEQMEIDGADSLLPPLESFPRQPTMVEQFRCQYEGCTAPPFPTQKLLK